MQILEATVADVPQLCTLVNSAYRGDSSRLGWTTEADLLDGIRIDEPTLYEFFQDNNATILKCLNEQNSIIGCVYLKTEGEHLYLGMLTVAPDLQANGIGKRLLQASEEKARSAGCKSIVMTVISTRKELISWYNRHGYFETGEKQPFPSGEKFGKPKFPLEFFVMQKTI